MFEEMVRRVTGAAKRLFSICESGPNRIPTVLITGETGTGKELIAAPYISNSYNVPAGVHQRKLWRRFLPP